MHPDYARTRKAAGKEHAELRLSKNPKGALMNLDRMDFQRTGEKASAGRFERGYLKT